MADYFNLSGIYKRVAGSAAMQALPAATSAYKTARDYGVTEYIPTPPPVVQKAFTGAAKGVNKGIIAGLDTVEKTVTAPVETAIETVDTAVDYGTGVVQATQAAATAVAAEVQDTYNTVTDPVGSLLKWIESGLDSLLEWARDGWVDAMGEGDLSQFMDDLIKRDLTQEFAQGIGLVEANPQRTAPAPAFQ